MSYILLLVLLGYFIFAVDSVHFLGGTITWRPVDKLATGSPVSIIITQTYSWTYGVVNCTNDMIVNNQMIIFRPSHARLNSAHLNCINNCPNNSLNYTAPLIRSYCTDISAPVGTIVGQRSDIVNLTLGDNLTVAFQEYAWRPLKHNSAADWSLASRIQLTPRSDNGLYNNAPVATVMSPIYIPVNHPTTINIQVSDADGDFLRCRWSNNSNGIDECGQACPPISLPQNTTIYPNCTIIITGENISDWHAVTVTVEDFMNSVATTPLSSVPIQFLVQVVGPPPCTNPPEIIGIPLENSCTLVTVGQAFTTQLIAINNCGPNVTISDISTFSFVGMLTSSLTMLNSTIFYKTLTWTPSANQLGYQQMCAMALDSQGVQSSQYCFKFYVSYDTLCACPGSVCTSTTSTTEKPKSNSIDWPFIGTISSLLLLGSLALSCCLYCYCFRPWAAVLSNIHGKPELYHIDHCTDTNCHWSNTLFSIPETSFIQSEKHLISSTSNDGSNNTDKIPRLSNITIGIRSSLMGNKQHKNKTRFRNKNMEIVKDTDKVSKHRSGYHQYANVLPIILAPSQKAQRFNNESRRHRLNGVDSEKRTSVKTIPVIRVRHTFSEGTSTQSLPADDPRLSIFKNTIQSDKVDCTRRSKRERSKVRVVRMPSNNRSIKN